MFTWITRSRRTLVSSKKTNVQRRGRRILGGEQLESRDLFTSVALPMLAPEAPAPVADAPAALVGTLTAGADQFSQGRLVSGTQIAEFQQLAADLQTIHSHSTVTPQQVQQLLVDTAVMLQGAQAPSQASVQTLVTDLKNFTADGQLTKGETAKLTADLTKVLKEANIPVAEAEAVAGDVQAIVTASGVTVSDVQTIINDIKAILTP